MSASQTQEPPSKEKENAPKRQPRTTVAERVTRWIEQRLAHQGLPHNLELERETLSALMLGDTRFCGIAFSSLDCLDFASPVHQAIYSALVEAWETGIPFNTPALLIQWMRDCGLVARLRRELGEASLGVQDLLTVMQANGMVVHAEHYARSLRRLRLEREVWLLLVDATKDARNCEPAKWLDSYSKKLEALKKLCG